MTQRYILNGRDRPQLEPDLIKWAQWFESADRSLARDEIDTIVVSTVFLGINHGTEDSPLLYETMVFGGEYDGWEMRHGTRTGALDCHHRVLQSVRDSVSGRKPIKSNPSRLIAPTGQKIADHHAAVGGA